jgi:hypothetical protein
MTIELPRHQPKRPAQKPEPPPNPREQPPFPHVFADRLERIAFRIGRPLRVHWMRDMRIWSAQELDATGWKTVCAFYDPERATERCPFPYINVDVEWDRCLRELCEACLEIRYNTGDVEKDRALREKEAEESMVAARAKADQQQIEEIAEAVTGGDPKYMAKAIRHEQYHGVGGAGFRQYWRGVGLPKREER